MPSILDRLFGRNSRDDQAPVIPVPAPDFAPLVEFGYPTNLQKAFLDTTKSVKGALNEWLPCTIMSRSPGGAGTSLIQEGYDLKGFQIKAKSCNWGPMAGFICQHPALNKAGESKAQFNTDQLDHYIHWRNQNLLIAGSVQDVQLSPAAEQELLAKRDKHNWNPAKLIEERNKIKASILADQATYYSPDPFQHLLISDDRRKEVLGIAGPVPATAWPHRPDPAKFHASEVLPGRMWAGVACSADDSVCMDFLLMRDGDETLWKVYYREVFTLAPGAGAYAASVVPVALGATVQRQVDGVGLEPFFGQLWQKLALPHVPPRTPVPAVANTPFTELHVAVNPYMAYTGAVQRYLNSVSGDYDLFATWPTKARQTAAPLEPTLSLLTRVSELSYTKTNLDNQTVLFRRLGEQLFRLQPVAAPNLIIDMMPDFGEIGQYEDHDLGNIHDLVQIVAQTFNSIAAKSIQFSDKPNRAFHSDECGRPQVDEIEFPIGVFLSGQAFLRMNTGEHAPPNRAKLMRGEQIRQNFALDDGDYDLFVWLIALLRVDHYVTLNKGWLYELCDVAMTQAERNAYKADVDARYPLPAGVPGGIRRWIQKRDRWHDPLHADHVARQAISQYVRDQLYIMFVGVRSATADVHARQDRAFSAVLRRFVEFVYIGGRTAEQRIQALLDPIAHPGAPG